MGRPPVNTREQIIAAIRAAAERLGRAPSRRELKQLTGVTDFRVKSQFPSFRDAIAAAGYRSSPKGRRISTRELLADWGRVSRKLSKAPTQTEYRLHGEYSICAFVRRFAYWNAVEENYWRLHPENPRFDAPQPVSESPDFKPPASESEPHPALPAFDNADKARVFEWAAAAAHALPAQLAGKRRVTDALCMMIVNTLMGDEIGRRFQQLLAGFPASPPIVGASPSGSGAPAPTAREIAVVPRRHLRLKRVNMNTPRRDLRRDRPIMGPPLDPCALTNAPSNEMGVLFLYGMLAGELGLQVQSVGGPFPDSEAHWQVRPGQWQRIHIELEYESRNFVLHKHDPDQCDVIICWRHNWPQCPAHITVIELSRFLGGF